MVQLFKTTKRIFTIFVSMKNALLFTSFMVFLLQSCLVHDAKESKHEFVHVYSDFFSSQDKQIFKKFKKEQKIHVKMHLISPDSLENFLRTKKYNAGVDLIILKDYEKMASLSKKNLLLSIRSEKLEKNVDPLYHSKYNKWFALSKTPLVFVYNAQVLKKDTISSYYDLISPRWKGKIAFQNENNPTQISFRRNIRLMMKEKTDSFIVNFYKQALSPRLKDDLEVLEKVNALSFQLGLIKMSSFIEYQTKNKGKSKLNIIFPNQRKRGSYFTVTASGIYRYAQNPLQARSLLEYLSSANAQYAFAEGRYEFPILKGVNSYYLIKSYGKVRGRFFKGRN